MTCQYFKAWIGKCGKHTSGKRRFCSHHNRKKCRGCGKKAIQECGHSNSFVCGVPICYNCTHYSGGSHAPKSQFFVKHIESIVAAWLRDQKRLIHDVRQHIEALNGSDPMSRAYRALNPKPLSWEKIDMP